MRDEPAVRRAALRAGAWCREPGVLSLGQESAASPTLDKLEALEMLAVLGGPEDLPLMRTVAGTSELGPARYRLLGSYGHPEMVDLLIGGLRGEDDADARAAAAAFTRVTGLDPGAAERDWEAVKSRYVGAPRLFRGLDPRSGLSREAMETIDMESRWEVFLRSNYTGDWSGSAISLEVFPQAPEFGRES
jgi:hypothetical protein